LLPDVDALFKGAVFDAAVVAVVEVGDVGDVDDVDEPPAFVVADVVDEAEPAALVALPAGSGCLAVGSAPQPTHTRSVTQRQTGPQADTYMT
jgi:hypothetical protein